MTLTFRESTAAKPDSPKQWRLGRRVWLFVLLLEVAPQPATAGAEPLEPLTLRARVKRMEPAESSTVSRWRFSGKGPGKSRRGSFFAPNGSTRLAIGQWSMPLDLMPLVRSSTSAGSDNLFLTVTGGSRGRLIDRSSRKRQGFSRNVVFEFEVSAAHKVIKRFEVRGPDGGTVTILIPTTLPDTTTELANKIVDVLEHAKKRYRRLARSPYSRLKRSKKFTVVTNLGGYGSPGGFGARTTDRSVVETELKSLTLLGVNALRNPPDFLIEAVRMKGRALIQFSRAYVTQLMGFPAPRYRKRRPDPEAGCPFAPGVEARTKQLVEESVKHALSFPVDAVWGLTVDEIGTVIDRSPERKAHFATCGHCAKGFRRYLKRKGLRPQDLGAKSWDQVAPLNVWPKDNKRPWLTDRGVALTAYYTRDFNNYATAKLFTPLRDAVNAVNRAKRRELAEGHSNSVTAQPWIYSYALRGNNFLRKGHSLELVDYYRHSDNAFVWETTNRDPRVWGWTSYMSALQRVVSSEFALAQGIYIKPHRGAVVQRTLAAVSQGATMIYWYTYGPDYAKGDSFSGYDDVLRDTQEAAYLLGEAEKALYRAKSLESPRIAIVNTESGQRWMNLYGNPDHLEASWSNTKWIFTALQHAHLDVDVLDESLLTTRRLADYKVIYVGGTHITKAAAMALDRYVRAGGTLYTSAGGLTRDEANQPLLLGDVLGLRDRMEPQMMTSVDLYNGGYLAPLARTRSNTIVTPTDDTLFKSPLSIMLGREILKPANGTDVLARFDDGGVAITRRKYGRGTTYVVGFYPGLEYAAPAFERTFDMARDFGESARSYVVAPAAKLVQSDVEVSQPLVEGRHIRGVSSEEAVVLMNWAYSGVLIPLVGRTPFGASVTTFRNVEIQIRMASHIRSIRSVKLGHAIPFIRQESGAVELTLPHLERGDVLLLN